MENEKKNENVNQITILEDTKFEKELLELKRIRKEKMLNELRNKRKSTRLKRLASRNSSFSRSYKNKSNKRVNFTLFNGVSAQDNKPINEFYLNKELSFIDDLSLSSVTQNSKTNDNVAKSKLKKIFTNFVAKNTMILTKLANKKNLDNLSYDDDLFNNNLFGTNKLERKSKDIKKTELDSLANIVDSFTDKNSIINSKEIEIYNGIRVKSKFKKPHSILNFLTKYEEEDDGNNKFNLKKYLKKEMEKDNEFLNKDRRKSFLGFLEYAQFQKELKELDEIIKNDSDKENYIDDLNSENDLHFLNEDSYLSRSENNTIEDIELLPKKMNEKKIFKNEYLIHENIKKNIESNKLTQLIRAEVFDRESINTNINLTTNELKKYYEETNRKLDEQLFPNRKKIRIRKDINLDISGIINKKDLNKSLKSIEDLEDSDEEKSQKIENNNNDKNQPQFLNSHIDTSGIPMKKQKINLNINEKKIKIQKIDEKRASNNRFLKENFNLSKSEKNSDFPFLNRQKTIKLLNLKVSNENDKNDLNFNTLNKDLIRNQTLNLENQNLTRKISIQNSVTKKTINSFIFKAKSIDKNINKYPKENSNKFLVKEENKEYTDPLTVKQELIPSNF